jgi:hypothetical protein
MLARETGQLDLEIPGTAVERLLMEDTVEKHGGSAIRIPSVAV